MLADALHDGGARLRFELKVRDTPDPSEDAKVRGAEPDVVVGRVLELDLDLDLARRSGHGEGQMRQYQELMRSEIHDRLQAISAERDELERALDETPDDGSLQHVRLMNEYATRSLALAEESTQLKIELIFRDKPPEELAELGGPGKD